MFLLQTKVCIIIAALGKCNNKIKHIHPYMNNIKENVNANLYFEKKIYCIRIKLIVVLF